MFKCTFRYLKRTSPTDTEWTNGIRLFDATNAVELEKLIDKFIADSTNSTQSNIKLTDVVRL